MATVFTGRPVLGSGGVFWPIVSQFISVQLIKFETHFSSTLQRKYKEHVIILLNVALIDSLLLRGGHWSVRHLLRVSACHTLPPCKIIYVHV